jgi:hypothetical protein
MAQENTWNKEGEYNMSGEYYILRSFMICTPHQTYLSGEIKE